MFFCLFWGFFGGGCLFLFLFCFVVCVFCGFFFFFFFVDETRMTASILKQDPWRVLS